MTPHEAIRPGALFCAGWFRHSDAKARRWHLLVESADPAAVWRVLADVQVAGDRAILPAGVEPKELLPKPATLLKPARKAAC